MKNLIVKATLNEGAKKAICTAAKEIGKVAGKGVLTNPATLTAAVAVTGIYCTYKYLDNKDKRRYESKAY